MNKKIFYTLLLSFLLSLTATAKKKRAYTNYNGVVQACHDGDTCKIQIGHRTLKVRFAGIDAPEIKQPEGPMAQQYLESLIVGKMVDLKCEGKSFDRTTCTVYLNEQSVNQKMVASGMAFDSPKYSKGLYKNEMENAKQSKLGIWKSISRSPACFRHKKQKSCVKNPLSME
jgi:micrococcal nuclease